MNEQDITIISQLRKGDEDAYRYLFTHYYADLYKVAFLYVDNPFVAEDLVEDLILNLWQQRESLDIHTSLRAYLFTAIRRRSLNYLKEAHRTHEVALSEDIASSVFSETETNPLGKLVEKELEEKIALCVEQLPKECRTVFTLSRYKKLSYEVIAEQLGITINTVGYHISNALAILRKQLSEYLPALLTVALSFLNK
jgi:RNA polymerase sigma-70 factor (ECF subfamily)